MSHAPDYSYLGSGIILVREWGSTLPLVEVGNCSAFSVAPQTNQLTLADHTRPGGGVRNRVDRISDWQLSYSFHDFSPENFARATRGLASTIAAGSVANEEVAAARGVYVPLSRIASSITSVQPVGTGPAYVAGEDYIFDRGMLYIPDDSDIPASVNGAPNIRVTYAHGALGHVEAAVVAARQYEMQFHGENEALSGRKVKLVAHRVSGGVIQQLGLLGEEYGVGEVQGSILADPSKRISTNHSAYFYWQQER
ncbi:hypothetical protein ABE488_09260 [Luteimonas sp. TWI662]|uniref:phage tail tube protein n=1 Tax=Luteimonas sp. TWI662 TaxID=3136789 RepID=UPI00320B2E18